MTHRMYTPQKFRRVLGTALMAIVLALTAAACSRGSATPTTAAAPTGAPAATGTAPTKTTAPTATAAPTKAATAPADESAGGDQPLPNDTPAVDDYSQVYSNSTYGVTFVCPAGWKATDQENDRYEGEDGFFQVGLISGEGLTIGEVAENEANHKLQPYGSQPTIQILQAPGQAARLILPSDDQPADMNGQAAIIAEMPSAINLGGVTYHYMVLWADQDHIRDLGKTMTFSFGK